MPEILNINYEKFTLKNGLEVVFYEDKTIPIVTVNLWYKVGSANERKGKTGFAHLFEHMMFQGSKHVPKEKHFKYIQEAGGTLNGSTSFDRTNYYETLPADSLELALWLESDRMGFLLDALTQEKLDNQIGVVSNERRERYDNQPYGRAWELLFSNLFPENHPYHWPTIGWMEDILAFKLEDIKEFFSAYYSPNNASLVIAGDFDSERAKDLTEQYFGEFEANENIPAVSAPDFSLTENKTIIHKENVPLPKIYLAWKSDKLYGEDDAALDIISEAMSGSKNSRLFKSLVFEKQIAQDIGAFQFSAKYDGTFIIVATAKPDVPLDKIKEEIFNQIEVLKNEGPEKKEIEKAKNVIKSTFIYSLEKLNSLADIINGYNCNLGEPNSFNYDLSRYYEADENFIHETINKYFSQNYVELRIIPKEENDK